MRGHSEARDTPILPQWAASGAGTGGPLSWRRASSGLRNEGSPRPRVPRKSDEGSIRVLKDDEATTLWRVLYGAQHGLIAVHAAIRPYAGSGRLARHRSSYFAYPRRARTAAAWCLRGSEVGLEAYFCAHLLKGRRRTKENAAPVVALWADADGGPIPPEVPQPTAIVETSPGHAHLYWKLMRSVSPRKAEELNRRLLVAARADRSGWDLTQLLRPLAPATASTKRRPGSGSSSWSTD